MEDSLESSIYDTNQVSEADEEKDEENYQYADPNNQRAFMTYQQLNAHKSP